MISSEEHIIGKTSWDYAQVKNINPAINYHFCIESDEIIRLSADKYISQ